MISFRATIMLAALLALAACQGSRPTSLPSGPAAYAVVPAAAPGAIVEARALRPGDEISVQVYGEPDLSVDKLKVDELGNIQLPLVGQLAASGRSPPDLARQIGELYGSRYLRNPRVTVGLVSALEQAIAIEGEVRTPGVFPIGRGETLLTSLSRAGSPTREAKLDQVLVFRTVNGQRMGAVFDVADIRTGNAADPQILDGDLIVVGFSQLRGAFREFLQATPLLTLFQVF